MPWVLVGNIKGAQGQTGAPGANSQVPGKDGLGIKSANVDKDGILRIVRDDGQLLAEARVLGAAGEKGDPGVGIRDAATDDEGRLLLTLTNGDILKTGSLRGEDGLGFDDMRAEQVNARTIRLTFERGDRIKTFDWKAPVVLYKGVWEAKAYEQGDEVTWGGSQWIAMRDTSDQPETSDAWRLAVKKGRDGRNGKDGEKGDPGPQGRAGRDLTQLDPQTGEKW